MPRLTIAVRTLVSGGFVLEAVDRNPGYALLRLVRDDEFGARHGYSFAVADDRPLTATEVDAARVVAEHHHSRLIIVGEAPGHDPIVSWDRFLNLFGGPVVSASALDPEFGNELRELGFNRLPATLSGRPDDLFEAYVRAALEFIFAGRVIRYGQDRRGEARPDGIALPGDRFRALYDAKAYAAGYDVTLETIRQFEFYISEFHRRYATHIPRLSSFIVTSGNFPHAAATLQERSTQLLALTGVPLSFVTADTLADVIELLAGAPAMRRAIDWGRIFSRAIVETTHIAEEMRVIERDGIVRA